MEENNYIKLITESKKKRIVKAKDLNNPFFSCYGRMGQIVVLRIVGYFLKFRLFIIPKIIEYYSF